ncbi:phosphoribosylformylglycinamidine synthase subunit PurL [Aciditerrimonas ferrireducens]|uniref:phosphoribosylformylglycinamidine synthase subunit PurL n=1 Tax=Aciditerrimonas ferrireducens TaxID=667306 RepID=UPI002005E55F|nr:phosphoribosylformylglycinamidine synthase subunit PurL [Aciditerrimonas ferrireducens]MCK4177566.1 phosphoribosylformylglycinamidine synthase subunit PurL [Aciditerrimonas ferrireducens]
MSSDTLPLHRALGLTDDEAQAVEGALGRPPNPLELAMFSVMWSEHCSYKSSRLHLRRLPTSGPAVLVGPGENAGVVDVGDGLAVAVRIESHNHPSAVEPTQGAATGIGGILRDVFTMGARPLALLDPIYVGPLEDPRSRWHLDGIVRGISAYGNAVGVPTVGGELVSAPGYARNLLVNVMCIGVLPTERLALARAEGPGNLVVLLGAATGRDGIGGVSVLASAGFAAEPGAGDEKRPSVQVGDPYEEKRLMEACLELLERRLLVALCDLGGAGLTCAASETAARGGVGIDLDVRAVPRREPGMTPAEVMTSESQERMLAVVEPARLADLQEVCDRWEVRASVIGRVTPPVEGRGRLRVLDGPGGAVLADVPAAALADEAPCYRRPARPPARPRPEDDPGEVPALDPGAAAALVASWLADPAWAYQQYDHQLLGNTVVGPGGDAAVLRLAAPGVPWRGKGLAVSADGNPRWCAHDPRVGTTLLVAEATLNVACGGGRPICLVNCLNLGNPEHPEVAWQLEQVVDGLAEACRALDLPVVGGNVSLYNEAGGQDIDPTPVVAVLGLLDRLRPDLPRVRLVPGARLLLLGRPRDELGGSRFAQAAGRSGGPLPAFDPVAHRRLLDLLVSLVHEPGLLDGLHDVADGGLALALAELALAGGVGAVVRGLPDQRALFSEAPSRVVVCTREPAAVRAAAEAAGVPVSDLGETGGDRLLVPGLLDLDLESAHRAWRGALPRWLD